jgi:class 3 adenylate cyclase
LVSSDSPWREPATIVPETRYARSGDVHIAYQAFGSGPPDMAFVAGFTSHCEHQWEQPALAASLRRMASFSRLVWFDKRGTGLSDPVPADQLSLELRMRDMNAVLDAVGSSRAAVFGASDGGPMCTLYAATYPDRVSHLVLYGTWARFLQDADYPVGLPAEAFDAIVETATAGWGRGDVLGLVGPSVADDPRTRRWWGRWERLSASPGTMAALVRVAFQTDVRRVLPLVRAPTLVLHRTGDRFVTVDHAHYLAEHIPDARLVELPGVDHPHFIGDWKAVVDEVEEFVTGTRNPRPTHRVLATVLFTDIVGSTEQATRSGDRRWLDLLEAHNALVRRELDRYGGREVKTVGDGFVATFDGPARAVRCAQAITGGVRHLGLEVRAGVHTGEVELLDGDIGGIAVHIAARVNALAAPGEVLVSRTVKDLVAGSGIGFVDRGSHTLKGIPEDWQLLAATAA